MSSAFCQHFIHNDAGRFAPFMFGLLLAVTAFSMTMKGRVEARLAAEKQQQQHRAQQAADDLKQALEVDMLLEGTYNSTIDLTRAQKYLSGSSGVTAGGAAPTLNNQTGATLDGLARQTSLIGVTDDSLLAAAMTADSNATAFMSDNTTLPTAVFDAQATRQTQLSISKQNLDAFSAQILEFARGNGRMPTTAEMATIAAATGLGTFWSDTFSHVANLFDVTSSFTSPWGGGDTYSNSVTLPYPTTNPPYTWAAAVETSQVVTASSSGNNLVAVGPGVIVYSAGSNSFILERQDASWAEASSLTDQVVYALTGSVMLSHNVTTGDNNVLRRQNDSWETVQTLTDPDGGTATSFGDGATGMVQMGDRLHLYVKDKNPAIVWHYFVSESADVPNFVFQSTITPPLSCSNPALAVAASIEEETGSITPSPTAVIGCPGANSSQGIAYVYKGTTLLQTLSPGTLAASDGFGSSLSLRWPYLAIGAPLDEVSASENGAVYIYQDIDPSLSKPNFVLMTHFEDTTLTTPSVNSGKNDFGRQVAFIDDRSLGVQARYTNSLGTGNDSDLIIYTLTSAGWTKVRQVSKTSTAGTSERFGGSIAGEGGIMAVSKRTDSTSPALYIYTAPEF